MRLILNTILALLLVLPCYAFEPDKHEEFSKQAALVYKKCTGRTILPEYITAFAEGAVHEDDLVLSRILNWHFYNNENKIGCYRKFFLKCNGSNEKIYQTRIKELENMITDKKPRKDIYEVAGRIAHHIQDMSSPPHVAPIYHVGCDKFDKYKFDRYKSSPISDKVAARICKNVKKKNIDPKKMLKQAAKNTLNAINTPVVFDKGKIIECETWKKFWGGPDDEDLSGFKTYGEYNNKFGIISPCRSDVCSAYNNNVYDKFYNERFLRAVTDTVRLLIYLDKRIVN